VLDRHWAPLIIDPAFICRTVGRACALVTERARTLAMRCCGDHRRSRIPGWAPSRKRAAEGILADL